MSFPSICLRIARFRLIHLVALASLLVLPGCGNDSGTGPETASVGPAGGTLSFAGGRVTLIFPAGAVSSVIDVTVVAAVQFPDSSTLVRATVYDLRPPELQLDQSVQLLISYDPRNMPLGALENDLRMHKAQGNSWRLVPSSAVSESADVVAAPIESFGLFAILWTPPLPDQ